MKFLRCNLVDAKPMTRGAYNKHRGWKVPPNENPKDEGYIVVYPDGYESWCPKARFLEQSFPLKDKNGCKIEQDDIIRWQQLGVDAFTSLDACGKPATLLQRRHPTGFVEYETSSCVDPKNYSETTGAEICAGRLDQSLWNRLGFMLAWAYHGIHQQKPTGENEPEIVEWNGPREPEKAKKKRK